MAIVLTDKQVARFWGKVDVKSSDECWGWLGSKREHGYGYFKIYNRKIASHRIAFLIANAQLEESLLVIHSCDNPECNNPNHLTQGSVQDNVADREAKGRWGGGTKSGKHLEESDVIRLKLMLQAGYSHVELGRIFNLTRHHIQQISAGVCWSQVDISGLTPLEPVDRNKYLSKGENIKTSKLTEADVIIIKRMLAEGTSTRLIAVDFEVTNACIRAIRNGITWAWVK